MRSILEHIDDLDRMVDGGSGKPEIRSQIAFIGREVAALVAEHEQLAQAYAKLQEAHLQLQASKADPSADSPADLKRISMWGGIKDQPGG